MEEKLDRIIVTKLWWDLFSSARAWNLEASYSDHSPLFLDFCYLTRVYKHKRFRCENVWLREAHCKEVVDVRNNLIRELSTDFEA